MKKITTYLMVGLIGPSSSLVFGQTNNDRRLHELMEHAPSNNSQRVLRSDSLQPIQAFLREVLDKNPRLQAARTRIQSFQARIPQVKAWDDPQAGVEFFATPVTSANPFTEGMETDYFVQQMIPFFGKKSLMGDVATASVRVVEQSAATIERALIAEVKRAYAMLYSAQRRMDVNTENQGLLNQIIESARAKYSVGITPLGDVLKAQVELAKLQNERATLKQEVQAAEAMMNALRSVPSRTPIGRLEELRPQQFLIPLDDLYRRALSSRPELRGMKYEIEMNKAELAVSQRERYPDFMVRGMYKQMREGTDFWAGMIGINIPLAPWAWGKYSQRIKENTLNVRVSEQSLTDMENMVQFQVREAWTKVQSRWQQVDRYQRTILPQAEQTLQSTLASYQTDKVDFLTLLDSYRLLQTFRMEYYMLVGEYYSDLALLEKAIGSDL